MDQDSERLEISQAYLNIVEFLRGYTTIDLHLWSHDAASGKINIFLFSTYIRNIKQLYYWFLAYKDIKDDEIDSLINSDNDGEVIIGLELLNYKYFNGKE